MCSLAISCVLASLVFSNGYWPFFFFSLFSSLSSLHILYLFNFSSFFFCTKASTLSLSFPSQIYSNLLQSQLLSQTLSSPTMAPKSRKSSYVLSTDIIHLTHWNGVVRLTAAPTLSYRSQQHILEGARTNQ